MSPSGPDFSPVERFVRDVLPLVPGGRQNWDRNPGHMALIRGAAKDRGLTERTVGSTIYFYDGRWPIGGLTNFRSTLTGGQALAITRSKSQTKQMLRAAGLPVPAGHVFTADQVDEAVAQVRSMGMSVLKPSEAKAADGLTAAISTEADLRAAWLIAAAATQEQKNPEFLLEEQIAGVDLRVFVVGRRAIAAVTRVNAHVVGDGRRSIAELVAAKQEQRARNAMLTKLPIVVDTPLLALLGRAVDDVPAADEVVVLNAAANLHVGGEAANVTGSVHPDLMDLAVDVTRAIPGVGAAGIDLMTPDIRSINEAVVLEVNAAANISLHHCPTFGHPVDVAGSIVDELIKSAGSRVRSSTARRAGALPGKVTRRLARAFRR